VRRGVIDLDMIDDLFVVLLSLFSTKRAFMLKHSAE